VPSFIRVGEFWNQPSRTLAWAFRELLGRVSGLGCQAPLVAVPPRLAHSFGGDGLHLILDIDDQRVIMSEAVQSSDEIRTTSKRVEFQAALEDTRDELADRSHLAVLLRVTGGLAPVVGALALAETCL